VKNEEDTSMGHQHKLNDVKMECIKEMLAATTKET